MAGEGVEIGRADLGEPGDTAAIVSVLDTYARDAMGAAEPLAPAVRKALPSALRSLPTTVVLLARERGTREPLGVAVCFLGLSTFRARPLLNVHDLAVVPEARTRGIGHALLQATAREAVALGCCKITLEVLERNEPARALYTSEGFTRVTGPPGTGYAEFWERPLPQD